MRKKKWNDNPVTRFRPSSTRGKLSLSSDDVNCFNEQENDS